MPVNVGQIVISLGANTQAFSIEMTRAQQMAAQTSGQIQGTLGKLSGSTAEWGAKTKDAANESKAAMALLGEEFGVKIPRHIRGFLNELPGVKMAFNAAFSGLAIIGTVNVIIEAIKKVQEFSKSLGELSKEEQQRHEQAVKNAKDELGYQEKLINASYELAKSKATTPEAKQHLQIEQDVALVRLNEQYRAQLEKDRDELQKSLTEQRSEADRLSASAVQQANISGLTGGGSGVGAWISGLRADSGYIKAGAYSEALEGRKRDIALANAGLQEAQAKQNNDTHAQVRGAVRSDSYGSLMAEMRGKLAEVQAKAGVADVTNPLQVAQAREYGEAQAQMAKIDYERTAAGQAKLTAAQRDNIVAQHGVIATYDAVAVAKQHAAEVDKRLRDGAAEVMQKLAEDDAQRQQRIQALGEETAHIDAQAKAREHGADALHAEQTAERLASMTHATEAEKKAMAAKLDAEYRDGIQKTVQQLNQETAAIIAMTQAQGKGLGALRKAQMDAIEHDPSKTRAQKDAEKARQAAQWGAEDQGSHRYETAKQGLQRYFQDMQQSAKSAGEMMHGVVGSALDGISDAFSRMISGQKAGWADLMRSMAAEIAKLTMDRVFTQLLGGLFGGTGKGGTGAGGGLMATLGGLFGGHRALGGDVDPSKGYMVGENGPEWFNPPTKGSIVPTNKLGTGGASYYIDARGGNGPEVEQRVQRALAAVHGQAVRSAVAVQQDLKARMPRSKFA